MCTEKNITKLSFIMFIIFQNYLMFNYYFLSESIKVNSQMGYIFFIVVYLISLILILFLPKTINKIEYFKLMKKSLLLKYFFVIAKLIILFITLYVGVRTLNLALFPDTNILIFLFSLVIISVVLSNFKVENIINTSLIFFIVASIFMFIALFLNINLNDFSLLLPIQSLKSLSLLSCIYLFLDSITLIFLNDGVEVRKKDVFIGVTVLFAICTIETINVITLCGTNYINNNEFLGFFSLYIQDTLNYIGNLSFIYIFLVPVVCIFKSSLSIIFIKKTLNIKKNILFDIILTTLLIISIALTFSIGRNLITFLIYITIILLIPIYLFFVVNRNDNIEVTI